MPNLSVDNNKTYIDALKQDNKDEINLGELIDIIVDNKWLILAITFITLSLGSIKSFVDAPVYKADGLLQVKERSESMAGLEPLTGQVDTKKTVLAEIELIRSRMILGEAVNNLQLDIIAKPKYFPVFGEALARSIAKEFQKRNQDNAVSSPFFGLPRYAWGGEMIQVNTFNVPSDLEDKEFILQAGKNGQYKLILDNKIILEGIVGKLASTQLENHERPITIFVSFLKTRPNTHFIVMRQSMGKAINRLKNNISVLEKGKGTGLLELAVEAHSRESAVRILNEIANIYVQQNVEHKSAESQKKLEFLEKQLPILKEQLENATNAMNDYRTRQGSIDLNLETQNILKGTVELRTQLTLLQQKRDELRQKYTGSHPNIIAIDKQIARLEGQIASQEKRIEILPETQQTILRLSSDVNVNTELYTALLNNAQTLRVAKAGTVGSVRIVDYAITPDHPIKPKKTLIFIISLFSGLVLGLVVAFILRLLNRGVDDPNLIEKQLNIPVYATIPHSRNQKLLFNKLKKTRPSSIDLLPMVLALENKEDLAIESLRSLRTVLHFAFLEARNNMIMITGPSPNIGKTFVSANLAIVMADSGKKVLLIDGDMRKGHLNKILGVRRGYGLSELILKAIKTDDAINRISSANIDFISTGSIPPNPSELLLHEHFAIFLEKISKEYDLIIIDSPPILAVTDAAIIGRLTSATLMVAKAGAHPMRELEQATKRLVQAGVNLKGIVFNDLPQVSTRYGYGYGKHTYQYSYISEKQ